MDLFGGLRTTLWNFMLAGDPDEYSDAQRQAAARYEQLRDYQRGNQRRQIKAKPLQADDNITINFLGLIVERGISMLFGQGFAFDLPGKGETEQDQFIQAIWKANRQAILLHRIGQLAGTYGTGYLKILPLATPEAGRPPWRLMPLNPRLMKIAADAHDMDTVRAYTQRYNTGDGDQAVAHKIVTEWVPASAMREDGSIYQTTETAGWQETHYEASRATGGRFVQSGDVVNWDYPFAPIVHWQNLPDAESVYGLSDIEDVIGLQDRYNFIQSNNSKIVRYHAHPKTWGVGSLGAKASWGADEIIWLNGEHAKVANLEMQSELVSSRALALDIRQALFDIARTVDTQSLADQLGALTNFGLRVLFMDALNKNFTKQQLYGEALLEVNRRLLLLGGAVGDAADPGAIVWPDPLPTDGVAQSQAITADLGNGLVDKQTASGLRGYNWDQVSERLAAEQAAAGDVGSAILRAFGQGK